MTTPYTLETINYFVKEQIKTFDAVYDEDSDNDDYDEEIEWTFNSETDSNVVVFTDEFASSLKTNPSNYKCLWEMYLFNKKYVTENFGDQTLADSPKEIVALYLYLYAKGRWS
tara:strand:- start:168 stop:506 length:339 start_codon:yes stop_codon:yes gene_type:complete